MCMSIRIDTKSKPTVIINVDMLTYQFHDNQIEGVNEEIKELIEHLQRDEDSIIIGDWNARVG